MFLIAGMAVGIWIFAEDLKELFETQNANPEPFLGRWDILVFTAGVALLGGLSAAGVPLLLAERMRRPPRPWDTGRFCWFTQGISAWLLWPPLIYHKVKGGELGASFSGPCYFYGTPLMAVYITASLAAGGRLRRSRRRRLRLSWRERFGLFLGLAWACLGLYFLAMIYRSEFRR
jgi:hypothetical protein